MNSDNTSPELDHELPRSPLTMMAPALAGGIFGFLLITWNTGQSAIDRTFAALPEIHLWRLLIAAQFAYFTGILPAVYLRLRHVLQQRPTPSDLRRIVVGVVFALLAFFSPVLMAGMPDWGVSVLDERVPWVPIAAAGVVTVSCLGLMLIYLGFRRLRDTSNWDLRAVRDYLDKKQHARWFLSTLGIMIAFGTLATGALRLALDALRQTGIADQLPPLSTGMVLAYGAFFTVLLAIVYIPVHVAEQAVGRDICDAMVATEPGENISIAEFLKRRSDAAELLELGSTLRENLQASLAILSPVLAALVSMLIAP